MQNMTKTGLKTAIFSYLTVVSIGAYAAPSLSPAHDRVIAEITAEKSVFEAVWFNQNYLRATRYNTGTPQDGFAQYLCQVIADTGYKGRPVTLEIIDVVKLVRQKKWDVIGSATCRIRAEK